MFAAPSVVALFDVCCSCTGEDALMIVLSGLFSRQMTSEMIADIKTENTTDTETMIAIKGFPVICFTIDSWDSSNFKTLCLKVSHPVVKLQTDSAHSHSF